MSNVRLIAFDLDGTLLTTDKKLTEYTRNVLEEAICRGIEIVPATGRPLKGVPEEVLHFPGVRYAVTSNGARVVRTDTQETLYAHLLSHETAKEVLRVFKKYDTIRDIFYDGQGYMEAGKFANAQKYVTSPAMIEYMRKSRIAVVDIDEMVEKEKRPLDKVQALFDSQEDKKKAFVEISELKGVEASGALSNNIEVNAAGVHKGAALLELGEHLGIRAEEMLTFGDGSNDIGMIKVAGTGVAMGNGQPEVRAAADVIAASNDEEGVAAYIERYVLR